MAVIDQQKSMMTDRGGVLKWTEQNNTPPHENEKEEKKQTCFTIGSDLLKFYLPKTKKFLRSKFKVRAVKKKKILSPENSQIQS